MLARMARHALACLRTQCVIVALDGFGHAFMQNGQVVVLIYGRNINAHHARLAVAAVNAVSGVGMPGRRAQNARVIQVLAQCGVVAQSVLQVGKLAHACHNRGNSRAIKRVSNALRGRHGNAKGAFLRIKQTTARKRLHNGNTHAKLGAFLVERSTFGVNSVACALEIAEHIVQAARRWHGVKRRVQAEHDDLDERVLRRRARHGNAVRGNAHMVDNARRVELLHVIQVRAARHERGEFVHVVDEVNHTQIKVVGLQQFQLVLERLLDRVNLARAHVLAVLPGRTNVPLDNPIRAMRRQRNTQRRAHRWVGHPAVHNIHARTLARLNQIVHALLLPAGNPFGAKANFADHQAGLA